MGTHTVMVLVFFFFFTTQHLVSLRIELSI